MPKLFLRWIAAVLIPCLILDPAAASALNFTAPAALTPVGSSRPLFEQQALISQLLDGPRTLLNVEPRIAFIEQGSALQKLSRPGVYAFSLLILSLGTAALAVLARTELAAPLMHIQPHGTLLLGGALMGVVLGAIQYTRPENNRRAGRWQETFEVYHPDYGVGIIRKSPATREADTTTVANNAKVLVEFKKRNLLTLPYQDLTPVLSAHDLLIIASIPPEFHAPLQEKNPFPILIQSEGRAYYTWDTVPSIKAIYTHRFLTRDQLFTTQELADKLGIKHSWILNNLTRPGQKGLFTTDQVFHISSKHHIYYILKSRLPEFRRLISEARTDENMASAVEMRELKKAIIRANKAGYADVAIAKGIVSSRMLQYFKDGGSKAKKNIVQLLMQRLNDLPLSDIPRMNTISKAEKRALFRKTDRAYQAGWSYQMMEAATGIDSGSFRNAHGKGRGTRRYLAEAIHAGLDRIFELSLPVRNVTLAARSMDRLLKRLEQLPLESSQLIMPVLMTPFRQLYKLGLRRSQLKPAVFARRIEITPTVAEKIKKKGRLQLQSGKQFVRGLRKWVRSAGRAAAVLLATAGALHLSSRSAYAATESIANLGPAVPVALAQPGLLSAFLPHSQTLGLLLLAGALMGVVLGAIQYTRPENNRRAGRWQESFEVYHPEYGIGIIRKSPATRTSDTGEIVVNNAKVQIEFKNRNLQTLPTQDVTPVLSAHALMVTAGIPIEFHTPLHAKNPFPMIAQSEGRAYYTWDTVPSMKAIYTHRFLTRDRLFSTDELARKLGVKPGWVLSNLTRPGQQGLFPAGLTLQNIVTRRSYFFLKTRLPEFRRLVAETRTQENAASPAELKDLKEALIQAQKDGYSDTPISRGITSTQMVSRLRRGISESRRSLVQALMQRIKDLPDIDAAKAKTISTRESIALSNKVDRAFKAGWSYDMMQTDSGVDKNSYMNSHLEQMPKRRYIADKMHAKLDLLLELSEPIPDVQLNVRLVNRVLDRVQRLPLRPTQRIIPIVMKPMRQLLQLAQDRYSLGRATVGRQTGVSEGVVVTIAEGGQTEKASTLTFLKGLKKLIRATGRVAVIFLFIASTLFPHQPRPSARSLSAA